MYNIEIVSRHKLLIWIESRTNHKRKSFDDIAKLINDYQNDNDNHIILEVTIKKD